VAVNLCPFAARARPGMVGSGSSPRHEAIEQTRAAAAPASIISAGVRILPPKPLISSVSARVKGRQGRTSPRGIRPRTSWSSTAFLRGESLVQPRQICPTCSRRKGERYLEDTAPLSWKTVRARLVSP